MVSAELGVCAVANTTAGILPTLRCARLRSHALCQQEHMCRWLAVPPGLEIGVVGGSISACHFYERNQTGMLPAKSCYPGILAGWLEATVHNRAVPATGCALASFCLDALLPRSTQFILIEFAPNDAVSLSISTEVSRESVDGQVLDPRTSMERLLRKIRKERPHATPIIVYACKDMRSKSTPPPPC